MAHKGPERTEMYKAFYGLTAKPFSPAAPPEYLFLGEPHREALNHLKYGLLDGAGLILMTGDVGTGKTTLVSHLVERLRSMRTLQLVVVTNTSVIDTDFLGLINEELCLPCESGDGSRAPLLRALEEHLVSMQSKGVRALLVIDEAQSLGDAQLEELRMLSNLQTDQGPLLQIILSAQSNFRQRLSRGDFSQLAQRIGVACRLRHLDRQGVEDYINHRLAVAGRSKDAPELFTPEALDLLNEVTQGIPRLLNILCSTALIYGFAEEQESLDADVIREVVRDREESGLPLSPNGHKELAAQDMVPGQAEAFLERISTLEKHIRRLGQALKKHIVSSRAC